MSIKTSLGSKNNRRQAVAYVFTLISAAAQLPHVISVEGIPDYVRGRLSLRIHLEQNRRQHGVGRKDHQLDVSLKYVRSTPFMFAPATRGSNVLFRSSRNDSDLGYDCYGRTDNIAANQLSQI